MLVTASILVSVCLSVTLGDRKESEPSSLQHQYHPYHQYRASNHHHNNNNRRSFQRGLNLHHLHHNYRSPAKLSKLPSYGVKFQPKIAPPVRREDRKVFAGFPGHQNRNKIPSQQNLHLQTTYQRRPSVTRAQRKIEIDHLKLDNQFLKDKSTAKKKTERKSEEEEDDNIAVESAILETRVRPDPPAAPVKKSYSEPGPKFIIKQAGPSQQFGWVGHGNFAPLNIPNIFKTVGLNTAWLPGVNSVFPVGLNYPAPPSHHKHSPAPAPAPVKETTTTTGAPVTTETYRAPTTTTTTAPSLADIPVYKPSHATPLPAYRPPNKQNQIETLYYGSQIVNLYTPPVKTTTTTTAAPTTTTPTTTTYKPVTTTPTIKYTYKTYKTTSRPAAPFRYSSPPVSSPSPSYISTPAPYYGSSPHYGYGSPQPSIAPYHHSTPLYGYSPQPTIAPYHQGTPHYGYGSPQPSVAPHRNYHQPSSVRPFTAFTAFSRSTPAPPAPAAPEPPKAPIVGIIETEANNYKYEENSDSAKDGEVFYIFYENEDLPQKNVHSGLKRYIHEEIAKEIAADNLPSESIVQESKDVSNKFPNFALIEEIKKPEPAVFYDVPIKIEETGEGFDPPTIYVPIENAINVPENFQIDVGTSFGGSGSKAGSKKSVRKVRKHKAEPYYGSRLEPRQPADPLV